ncbi:hypothetical protein GYMLUDRAFT_196572 [Collybiopsis luxurians FD-317 M1]|uniref:Uncharacterized protein n=1 Tax=Collybiopsis luxurians FD-317 M1 TaxID=944289 RepID=A0A0D0C6G3_9AGAR|nr:hypothetical protein GYMLUDRAFT_196572 [Collybiopsis luxurians FD-317 M1]
METTHNADTEYLVRKASNAGYRMLSLLTPPAYMAYVLARRGRGSISINGLLRSTWIGGFAGAVGGGGVAFARYNFTNSEQVRVKRTEVAYDTDRIRAEDHSTIGGVLFAVLTPAAFWNRARIANLVLGGAALGSSVGMITHWTRNATGDPPTTASPV